MTVVDFIDVIDDIIDLSSDEETVQEDHNATQPQATLLDKHDVFVLADEERQDEQAAFVSAGEENQEATESENALVATASPSVMEKKSLDTAETKNCPSSPTSSPLPSPASTTPKALTSEVGDTKLARVRHPKKKYHNTSTPRRSPRFYGKSPVEELGADHKRSRMLDEPAEESAFAADNAASTKTLSTE